MLVRVLKPREAASVVTASSSISDDLFRALVSSSNLVGLTKKHTSKVLSQMHVCALVHLCSLCVVRAEHLS